MKRPSNNQGNPLVIYFADAFATIACDDRSIRRDLSRLFHHCQSATAPPASRAASVALTVRRDDDEAFTLFGAGLTPTRHASRSDLVDRVLYEVTVGLATSCQSDLVVHGAGLVCRGVGILLCGPSGSGKSTLTTRCLLSGYDFLSDEVVAVDLERLEMRGFARPIALKDSSAAFGDAEIVDDIGLERRPSSCIRYLDPERIRSGSVRARCALNVLVFPTYAADAPEVFRRLTGAETTFRLMPRIVNAKRLLRRGFDGAIAVARAIPAYVIGYSRAERALQWLEQIASECSSHDDEGGSAPVQD